jgi:hypothetical protein
MAQMIRDINFKTQPSKETLEQLRKNQKTLEDFRYDWEQIWKDIGKYIIPMREYMEEHQLKPKQRGKRHGVQVYDSTGVHALRMFTDGLMGYLVSPSIRWFALRMRSLDLMDYPDIRSWLQACEDEMYAEFRASNFYEMMHMFIEDGGSFGTATMMIEENYEDSITHFATRHPIENYISENEKGFVDILHRKYLVQARSLVEMYGYDKLSPRVQSEARNNPFNEIEIVHAVYPNPSPIPKMLGYTNMPYVSFVFEEKADGDRSLLNIGGYQEWPAPVWRTKKNSHEIYGRSPAFDALVDVTGLQQMGRDLLHLSHMASRPPWNIPAEMRDTARIVPDGFNFYTQKDNIIRPIGPVGDYPIGVDREEKKQKSVMDHFMVDFFLLLSQNQRTRTATEVIELQGEKAAVMGSLVGRFNSEAMDRIFERTFNNMLRNGRLPEPPEVVYELGGGEFMVEYLGPLAQAQRKYFMSSGITQSLTMMQPIFAMRPETMDIVDWDELTKRIFDIFNMPQSAIVDERTVMRIRQDRAAAQQAAAQAEAQSGQIAPVNVQKNIEPNSILAQMGS